MIGGDSLKSSIDPDIVRACSDKHDRSNVMEKALDCKQVEERYHVPRGTLANLRSRKEGCKFFKVGSKVYYRISDFEAWFFSQPVLTLDSIKDMPP